MDEQRRRGRGRARRAVGDRERVRDQRARAQPEAGFADRVRGLRDDRTARRPSARWQTSEATAAACSSSSPSRPSTPPAAGRSPTPATSSAPTATAARGWRTSCASATIRSLALVPERGRVEARRAGPRPGRSRRAARHRVQPHRHAPAARRAAAYAGHPRPSGRLLRRPRQAALRLHPRRRAATPRSCGDVEDAVNDWILEGHPVRALTTTLDEAKQLGAMALFGEKYGDVVRMVEVGDGSFSRELCGGTHVRSTAEIGLFDDRQRDLERGQRATDRGASPAPRRVELAARARPARSRAGGQRRCGSRRSECPTRSPSSARAFASWRRRRRRTGAATARSTSTALAAAAGEVAGARVLAAAVPALDAQGAARARRPAQGASSATRAIVLGSAGRRTGRPGRQRAPRRSSQRGVRAGEIVKAAAAAVVGGGGGGRDTLARAGGRDTSTSCPRRSKPRGRRSRRRSSE